MSYDPRWELLDRIFKSDTSVRVYDIDSGDSASKANVVIDGVTVASFAPSGFALSNGIEVNTFSIDANLSSDSTSVVPTEYAVKTYVDTQLASFSKDKISDGNCLVQVTSNTGDSTSTSTITFVLDNTLFMSLTNEGLYFDAMSSVPTNTSIVSFSNDSSMGNYNSTGPGEKGDTHYVPTQWAARKYVDDIHALMNEPSGFVSTTNNEYGIDQTGNIAIYYIQPISTAYSIFTSGQRWLKNQREEVTISDVEGLHYIYFDTDGILKETTVFNINVLYTKAYAAVVYWNADSKEVLYLGDERHGITMDGKTHANIHLFRGTLYNRGLALGDFTCDTTGGSDIDVQFSISNGLITDEDISHVIQSKTFPANIPMWYADGTSTTNWRKLPATDFPLVNIGSGRAAWNQFSGTEWSLTEAGEGNYVLTHVFATNDFNMQLIGIVGQTEYTTIESARVGSSEEINALVSAGLPFAEFLPIATVIYQTSSTYPNTPKARLVTNDSGSCWTDWRTTGLSSVPGSATDHGSLSGLSDDDHLQYVLVSGARGITGPFSIDGLLTLNNGAIITSSSLTLPYGAAINEFSMDVTMVGNSNSAVPTEKAVKTYVDTEITNLKNEIVLTNIRDIYSDTTAVTGDVLLIDTISGDVTITLQPHTGGKIMAKKISTDSNSVIIVGNGGLIDNQSSRSFSDSYSAYTYVCDGTNFYMF